MQRQVVFLSVWLAVSACSSGSGSGNDKGSVGAGGDSANPPSSSTLGNCGLRTVVTGGTAIQFTGQNDAACAPLNSFGAGLDVIFSGTGAKGSLELIVDNVKEGQTGSDFPSRVVVTSPERKTWQGSGCVTSITEHSLLRSEMSALGELRHYQVTGNGTCTASLDSTPGSDSPVTVEPFEFRSEVTWRDE
ncbi:MAG TPA: hypothetical protein VHB79_33260 [Polyangiaceae bacterium]|nr:hypothetical protein [Polyangiaceae bacterium]